MGLGPRSQAMEIGLMFLFEHGELTFADWLSARHQQHPLRIFFHHGRNGATRLLADYRIFALSLRETLHGLIAGSLRLRLIDELEIDPNSQVARIDGAD